MDTPNRTYCSNKSCSIFIRPSNMKGDKATCPECDSRTCTICKSSAHEGDCPQDPAVVALMATAAKEGFKQCPSCRVMVELTFGCNHMTYAFFDRLNDVHLIDLVLDVVAGHSSATNAGCLGRTADVPSSMMIAFLHEPKR